LEIEAEIEHPRRMGQLAHGDEVHARRRHGSGRFEREPAAGLQANGDVRLIANRDGLAHLIGREVVDQHLVGSCGDRLTQAVE
jgi:hypothetical protein